MAETSRRRGIHPIVSFILGILFGIILLVGTIVAAVWIALNYDLDKIDANKDSSGNYIYVNADPDDGGVKNAMELVSQLYSLATNYEDISIGKLESLLPITVDLTDSLFDALSEYIELDRETLRTTPVLQLGDYVQSTIMDIRVATLLENFGGSLTENKILSTIIYGTEAETVNDGSTVIPLYYDVYTKDDDVYKRGDTTLPSTLSDYIVEKNGEYRIYFYEYTEGSGTYYVAPQVDSAFYFVENEGLLYTPYSADTAKLSGNYYYDVSNQRVDIDPITIGDLADGSALDSLNNIYATDLLENSDNELTQSILGDITLGDLINGRVDIQQKVNDLKLSVFLDIEPSSPIMAYLGYGLTGVYQDEYGEWVGEVTIDGDVYQCLITTTEKDGKEIISQVSYIADDGVYDVQPTTVSGISDRISNITKELALADLMTINTPTSSESNAIMIFLAYSVTDLDEQVDTDWAYTGVYNYQAVGEDGNTEERTVNCYVYAENGKITRVVAENGIKTEKTTVDGVSNQVNRLTKILKIKSLVTISEDDKVMKKLGEHTISNVSTAIDDLTLDDFMTVNLTTIDSSSTILAYVTYGISDITLDRGNVGGIEYSYKAVYNSKTTNEAGETVKTKTDCYITVDGENKILTVFTYENGEQNIIYGTPVKGVSDRVSGLTGDLTIGQIMNIDESNKILHAIKDSTIDDLPTSINNLAINELYSDTIYKADNNSTTELYLAVNVLVIPVATEYNEKYVYYKLSDEIYSLAGTTGKLSESEYESYISADDPTILYTLGENDGKFLIKYDERFVYYTYVDGEAKIFGNVTESEFVDDTYYTYGSPSAVWKLLLYTTADGENVSKESVISVNDITKLVNNVTANIKKTTMRELVEAKIVDMSESDLELKLPYTDKTTYEIEYSQPIGDMTLSELINFILKIARG
jgi:hypothetical protein